MLCAGKANEKPFPGLLENRESIPRISDPAKDEDIHYYDKIIENSNYTLLNWG
jgi:hypothetical protein